MLKIGDRVRVSQDNDNDCYDTFRNDTLVITHISLNTNDHPGYDNSMGGIALYDFEGINCSLYEYEIETI